MPPFATSSSFSASVGDLCRCLPCRLLCRSLSMVSYRLCAVPLPATYATVCRASVGDPCRCLPCRLLCRPLSMELYRLSSVPLWAIYAAPSSVCALSSYCAIVCRVVFSAGLCRWNCTVLVPCLCATGLSCPLRSVPLPAIYAAVCRTVFVLCLCRRAMPAKGCDLNAGHLIEIN